MPAKCLIDVIDTTGPWLLLFLLPVLGLRPRLLHNSLEAPRTQNNLERHYLRLQPNPKEEHQALRPTFTVAK